MKKEGSPNKKSVLYNIVGWKKNSIWLFFLLKVINIENCCGLYPTIGENLDFLNSNHLGIHFLYRNIDQNAWKYCNKGFFNFKKYIPKIIEHIL